MNKSHTFRRNLISAVISTAIVSCGSANADTHDSGLLEILRDKGTLNEQEYESLKHQRKSSSEAVASYKDGFKISSVDGQHSIHMGGRVQADYRTFMGNDDQNADTFDIRRAYLQTGGQLHGKYKWLVLGNFAGSSASLVYAYADANFHKAANVQIGQFKIPMGLEELTSSRFINFQERSLAMQLVPAIDRGVMLHGEPLHGLYYALSASNGSGANKTESSNTEDDKDVTGRLAVNVADMLAHENAIYHFGGAYSRGNISAGDSSLSASTEAKGVKFLSTSAFDGDAVERMRYGIETALAYGPVKLQGEYVKNGFEGRSAGGVAYDRELDASYVALNWMLTGESYAGSYKHFKFDRMRPRQNFDTKGGWGAWEIGVRFSNLDASDFSAANPAGTGVLAAGATNGADAWTLGVKWIINPNTRVMLNYVNTQFDSPVTVNGSADDEERAVMVRAQLDF